MSTLSCPALPSSCWRCGNGCWPPTSPPKSTAASSFISRWAACAWPSWLAVALRWCCSLPSGLPIFWQRYLREKRLFTKQGITEAVAFVLPVVLVAIGLMWYNAARFGSPFDFGANYNLTSNDMTRPRLLGGPHCPRRAYLSLRHPRRAGGVPVPDRHQNADQLYGPDHHRAVLRRRLCLPASAVGAGQPAACPPPSGCQA